MNYKEFLDRDHFGQEELIAFAYGKLVQDRPEGFDGRLPAPPFLMVNWFSEIQLFRGLGRKACLLQNFILTEAWNGLLLFRAVTLFIPVR